MMIAQTEPGKLPIMNFELVSEKHMIPPSNRGFQFITLRAKIDMPPVIEEGDMITLQKGNRNGPIVIINPFTGRYIGTIVELRRQC